MVLASTSQDHLINQILTGSSEDLPSNHLENFQFVSLKKSFFSSFFLFLFYILSILF